MNLKELDSFRISDAISFHDKLNPKLWNNNNLRPEVKKQLLIIAEDFLEELGISGLDVADMTISGSNAAYSYTPNSDLDLHILVDMSKLPNNEVYKELFTAKKSLYNDSHDIKIHGIPVELYVQDAREPVVSLGEYSLKNDNWLKIPSKRRANFDQTATKTKYEKLLTLIELALKSRKYSKVSNIIKTIKRYRQSGLDKGGEFGPENLAYKALRAQGYITKLYDLRDKLHSEKLTIETMYQPINDDYDPNGPPPGPEFKPTMPKGTVRVDVSDVYDWYKLGQHISNLHGLGKHDFGKGPPSTIFSFGDEDTEHKYIKDLEKTGLTTTDIDPIDPNQPKGMPRQKIDPTYNVNEIIDMPPVTKRMDIQSMYNDIQTKLRYHEATQLAPINFPITNRIFRDGQNVLKFFLFNKENKPVYYLSTSKFHDGFKTGAVAGDAEVQGQGLGWKLYKAVSDYLGVPLYSDSTQTSDSKKGIWQKLIDNYPKQVVGYDQLSRKNVPINNIYQTLPPDQLKHVDDDTRKNTLLLKFLPGVIQEASGYIPSEKEKNDPRFSTALTVDVKPDSIKKNAKAFYWNTSRAGIPPTAKPSGKI